MRRIFRWYSERFHTPLHLVEDIPLTDILQAFFEVQYEELDPEERHNLAIHLLETPEERAQRELADKSSEEAFIRMTSEAAKKQLEKKVVKDQLTQAKEALERFKGGGSTLKPMRETTLPKAKLREPEEEIAVSYTDTLFDSEEDPMAPPKKA